ncbi:MAG: thiamine pyrophosphate-dependent enzyme [Euryarchaeota archaeon]|nr:thiamine pyrophosphate-dependent enzyme [Euryarchaeota archaeon]
MFETDGLTAIVYGLLDAGVGVATGVVGFPVTDMINRLRPIWRAAINEKVGLDIALGATATGTRSAFISKHVGLNVASDSLITAATQGIGAGLIIIAGDDPGAQASQNEQDSRYYGKMAEIPVLEPNGVQNMYDSIIEGFKVSEQQSVPVIARVTSRLLKMGGALERSSVERVSGVRFQKDNWKLTFLGRHQYHLKNTYPQLMKFAETTTLNEGHGAGAVGIISAGYASVLVEETIDEADNIAHLKLGLTNPLCERRIATFLEEHQKVIVIEEGAPIIEEAIRGKVLGKFSGHVPRTGALQHEDVERALNYVEADFIGAKPDVETLESRGHAASICQDCPFLPFYYALEKFETMVAGDLGCVIKTANSPLELLDVAYSLGSAIGVATGFEQEGVAVLGDYAFLHGGIEALLSAILFRQSVKVFVLENRVSAITGGQPTPEASDLISALCRNYGVLYKEVDAQSCTEAALSDLLRMVNSTTGIIVVVIKGICKKYAACREDRQD